MSEKTYFVIDMKSFFASVECAERGLDAMTTKLVVADKQRSETTICLAVSPALKKLGVKNRCRLYEIPKTLDFIIAKPRMKKYIEYASNIYAIYLKYIDKSDIHVYSIDECFLDVTSYLKLYKISATEFAQKLMKEIWENLGIPATTGIGTNMYLAKIALDITAKSSKNRVGELSEKTFISTLWNHQPLSDFWGISTGTINRLKKHGIFDMEGIATANEDVLFAEFGVNAELLIDHAWGREPCLMKDIKSYKSKALSKSSSQILPCNYSFQDAKKVLKEMVEYGCLDLVKNGYVTSLLHIYVGYGDSREEGAKKTIRMSVVTNIYSVIAPYVEKAYEDVVDKKRPIRKVGYDFCELMPENYEQYDLFIDNDKIEKEKKLTKGIIQIKDTFGKNAILKGVDYTENATQRERNKMIGGHNG